MFLPHGIGQHLGALWNSVREPEQRLMMPFEHGEGCAALSQPQGEAAGMLNHPGRNADDLLHHRADPSMLGGMPHRAVGADQGRLADGAQDVEGQHRQREHQIVGGELARRQPLQVQIGFEPGVELRVSAVPLVELDDLLRRQIQAGQPALDLDIRHQQGLPLLVDGALDQMHHPAHDNADAGVLARDGLGDIGLAFAFARPYPRGGWIGVQALMQDSGLEAARVPLHQPVQRPRCTGCGQRRKDGSAIEARIRPHQERQARHRLGARQQAPEEIRRLAIWLSGVMGTDSGLC